ncbi:MAG: MarR family transcriptional regulator [Chitinophagales bacterium]|nr:MarR family transcriptional regulator [Chitinophagales bacterium]MDW8428673.1 MarR family transcriptional regulator [Chitinophagales bacterium]
MPRKELKYYNPSQNLDHKLVSALARVAEVFKVLLLKAGGKYKLSTLQVEIMLFLMQHPPTLRTVSQLAREFNISKATMSIALRSLLAKRLVTKAETPDLRSFRIYLTPRGFNLATRLLQFRQPILRAIHKMDREKKDTMLEQLLQLLYALQQAGVISPMRMCLSCAHFARTSGGMAYCMLLQKALEPAALRIDCPEHRAA